MAHHFFTLRPAPTNRRLYLTRRRVGNGDFIDMAWMAREIARQAGQTRPTSCGVVSGGTARLDVRRYSNFTGVAAWAISASKR